MSVPKHLEALTEIVLNNLQNQQDWTELKIQAKPGLSRPLVSGLPPRRLYVHPDEQIEIIKAEKDRKDPIPQPPEFEWILPTHLSEAWSVKAFAAVFDAVEVIPPGDQATAAATAAAAVVPTRECADLGDDSTRWNQWRGPKRGKRILLATVQDDSTVVYYLMHDGIVKPRQN